MKACGAKGFLLLPQGLRMHDWDSAERALPSPPTVESGPFTEFRLAPSPAAAAAGAIVRRRAGSEQPIWQVLGDVCAYSVYALEATGVRIKDSRSDSRLAGGAEALREEGELAHSRPPGGDQDLDGKAVAAPGGRMSGAWRALDECFRGSVAAIELPADSALRGARLDRSLIAPTGRLEALTGGPLRIAYLGNSLVGRRDLLRFTDADGEPVGGRFAAYLARELARDLFSPRRQQTLANWLRFAATVISGLGILRWLLSWPF